MNESLQGQMHGLSMALTAIIQTLPPQMAREAAQYLRSDLATEQDLDVSNETSEPTASARDTVVQAYVALLSAR